MNRQCPSPQPSPRANSMILSKVTGVEREPFEASYSINPPKEFSAGAMNV